MPKVGDRVLKVSVILPVYRGAATLAESIASVLSQDVESMELIVLDDGSPDESRAIAESIRDPRLRVFSHPNRGLAATLNRGIELARGEFIARQDHDDLLLPGRLAKQVAFLERFPEIHLVGTWAQIHEGMHPSERYHRHPTSNEALRLHLLFDNPFVHSSMMMRSQTLREVGGYSEDRERQPPEDYELWSRIARSYQVANLPEVLTIYREMPSSISRTAGDPFQERIVRISAENLQSTLAPEYSPEACFALSRLYHGLPALPGQRRLSRRMVRTMFKVATERIADQSLCAEEFYMLAERLAAHLDGRSRLSHLPPLLVSGLRRVRNWLRHKK